MTRKYAHTRRDFLQTTATLMGGLTAGLNAPGVWAQDKSPIRLGATHDLTGALSMDGGWNDRTVRAAVQIINDSGGIAGRPVELHVEDTETNTQVAVRKMRSLILQQKVDFIVGATHSGHNIATNPIAQELRTPIFQSGTALETTTEKGNRWVFRLVNNIRQQMKAMAIVSMDKFKPRYYFVGADYAWGHSLVKETKTFVSERNGTIVGETFIPLGTQDFVSYLNSIGSNEFDVLVVGMTGGDALRFLRQAHQVGITKDVTVVGNIAVTSGSLVPDLGEGAQGSWYTTMYPRNSRDVPEELKEYDAFFRQSIGVTPEGTDTDTGRAANLPYCFVAWQACFLIKNAVEAAGWETRDDHPEFIKYLEGLEMSPSREFPQGPFFIRAEDHQIRHDQYITKIEGDDLVVQSRVPKEKLDYDPPVDYTTEEL